METYRLVLKSKEQLAASQMNTIHIGLANRADVSTFAQNAENIFSANVATINQSLTAHYELPYPKGTNIVWRLVLRDAPGRVQTMYLHNVRPTANIHDITTKLMDAGLLLYPTGLSVVSIVVTVFNNDH